MARRRPDERVIADRFGRYRLPDVLRALNVAVRAWADGTLSTRIDTLRRAERGHPMFDWVAAETARFAITHCAHPSFDSPILSITDFEGWKSLEPLIDVAVDTHLHAQAGPEADWEPRLLSQPLHNTMGRIWLPQYILQRRSPYRIGSALLLYGEAAQRRARRDPKFSLDALERLMVRALGVDLRRFLVVLLQAYGRATKQAELSTQILAPVTDARYDAIIGSRPDGVYLPDAYTALFATMSRAPREMRDWAVQQGGGSITGTEGPNPFARYPLARCFNDKSDHCVAPVPALILEWLYEPMVDQLVGASDSTFNRFHVAALFEEYVGLLAEKCAPRGVECIDEAELQASIPPGPGQRVVDWAIVSREHVVLIDAKRCFVAPSARYRWQDADWHAARRDIGKGIVQAHDLWARALTGSVPRLDATGKQAVALVVTHGDLSFHAARQDWRSQIDQALPGSMRLPWAVVSVDEYEWLVSAWRERDVAWLHHAVIELAGGRPVRQQIGTLSDPAGSPLLAALTRFIDEIAELVNPDDRDALRETARSGAGPSRC